MPISLRFVTFRVPRWALGFVAALAMAACVLAASSSSASALPYWSGWMNPQAAYADVSSFNMTGSWAQSNIYDWVGAGAHYPGGWTMYGSMAVAVYYACHRYAGGNNLGGIVQNASTVNSQNIYAADDPC